MWILFVLIGVAILMFFLNNEAGKSLGKKKRCPKCGSYGMSPSGGRYYRNGVGGMDWICPNCGVRFFK